MRFLLLILTILQFSCKTAEKNSNKSIVQEKTIAFNVIKEGTNSGFSTFSTIQVHAQKGMDFIWDSIFSNYMKKPPIPIIDFKTNELITVALGERNSGGFSIKVKSVFETKKNIIITIEESKPGKTCMNTSVMTYPYQIIELKKLPVDKKIIYTRLEKVYECEK
jgi:PrcB C-terminal